MNWRQALWPVMAAVLVAGAWRAAGWPGVALAATGIVTWMLLHFSQLVRALKRAADRPIGHVDSAVMLQSRLKAGQTLLHVIGLTRALGRQASPPDTQPEVFVWTDPGGAFVRAEFAGGRLARWTFGRPPETATGEPRHGAP